MPSKRKATAEAVDATPPRTRSTSSPKALVPTQSPSKEPVPIALKPAIPPTSLFFVVVIISLSLSAIAHTFAAELTGPELAGVSRSLDQGWQAALVLTWKIAELAVAWYGRFDDVDVLCLTILTHVPHLYFLHFFYFIPVLPLGLYLLSDVASNVVPLYLLRRRNSYHAPLPSFTRNPTTRIVTSLLASVVYIIPLLFSMLTWLPLQLILNFEGLKTIAPAHGATLLSLVVTTLPLGYTARKFLFEPIVHPSAYSNKAIVEFHNAEVFDPVAASFSETVAHNLFYWRTLHPRARVLSKRRTTLAALTFANTLFSSYVTVEGSELWGAAVWASVWTAGAVACGSALGWVADIV